MKKFALIISLTFTTLQIMAQKEIKTSIVINATPQTVWSILTDFENYPNWNPFISSAEGEIAVGEKLKITDGGMGFKPKVLVADENQELRWLGKLLFKGIFDGEHIFIIEDNKDGTVTFRQEEKFKGILVGMFSKKLDRETKPGFQAMNKKLKELAEAKQAAI